MFKIRTISHCVKERNSKKILKKPRQGWKFSEVLQKCNTTGGWKNVSEDAGIEHAGLSITGR